MSRKRKTYYTVLVFSCIHATCLLSEESDKGDGENEETRRQGGERRRGGMIRQRRAQANSADATFGWGRTDLYQVICNGHLMLSGRGECMGVRRRGKQGEKGRRGEKSEEIEKVNNWGKVRRGGAGRRRHLIKLGRQRDVTMLRRGIGRNAFDNTETRARF